MLKRFIAGALSASLIISATVTGKFESLVAEQTQPSTENALKNQGCTVEGKNSLGKMIGEAYSEQQNAGITPLSASASELTFEIADVVLDRESGKITVCSTQGLGCDVLVSIIDDDNKDHVINIKKSVSSGINTQTELDVDLYTLPEYFNVRAVLADKNGKELSKAQFYNAYTHFMQEMYAATVEDFEEEFVVNLDNDNNTNFFVLNEETVIADSSENNNTLVSADYNTETFIFDNIDNTIRGLEKGDYFYIQPSKTDIIAVSVDNVDISGNTATVKGTGDPGEIFSLIKIEADEDDFDDFRVEDAGTEGITYTGTHDECGVTSYNFDVCMFGNEAKPVSEESNVFFEDMLSEPDPVSIEANSIPEATKSYDDWYEELKQKESTLKDDPSFKGSVQLEDGQKTTFPVEKQFGSDDFGFTLTGSIYIIPPKPKASFYLKGFDFSIDLSVSATIGASLKGTFTIEEEILITKLYAPTPLAGVEVALEPTIVIKGTASFEIGLEFSPSLKVVYDEYGLYGDIGSDNMADDTKWKFKVSGSFYLGINLKPTLLFFNDKIVSIGSDAEAGVQFTVTGLDASTNFFGDDDKTKIKSAILDNMSDDCIHICTALKKRCVPVETTILISGGVFFDCFLLGIFDTTTPKHIKFEPFKIDLPKSYISTLYNEWHWGECPHKFYKVIFELAGTDEEMASLDQIRVDDDFYPWPENSKQLAVYCSSGENHTYAITTKDGTLYGNHNFSVKELKNERNHVTFSISSSGTSYNEKDPIPEPTTVHVEMPTGKTLPPTTTNANQAEREIIAHGRIDRLRHSTDTFHFDEGDMPESLIYYHLYKNGVLTLTGYGELDGFDLNYNTNKWADRELVQKNVKEIVFRDLDPENGKVIENIGNYLFLGCEKLESVTLPGNLKRIGTSAFNGCTSLKKITYEGSPNSENRIIDLPPSLEFIEAHAFMGCKSLNGEMIFSENIQEIGGQGSGFIGATFSGCSGLTKIIVPNPSCVINYTNMFDNCTSLKELTVPNICEKFYLQFGETATASPTKITVLNSKDIPSNAFTELTDLETVVLPADVEIIESFAFKNCTSLKQITYAGSKDSAKRAFDLPPTVQSVGNQAFMNDSALSGELIFSNSINEIKPDAFNGCSGLTNIVIPNPECKMEESYHFFGCDSLTEITVPWLCDFYYNKFGGKDYVPESLKKITVVSGKAIPSTALEDFANLETVVLPADVEEIGSFAFKNCTSLKSVTYAGSKNSAKNALDLPSTVKSIGIQAFINDTALTGDLRLSDSIEYVDERSFEGCTGFESITVPDGVTTISGGARLVENCSNVKSVYIPTSMKHIDVAVFGSKNEAFGTVCYGGTEEDWNKIEILEANDALLKDKNEALEFKFDYVHEAPAVSTRPGDANGDGIINVADAVAVLQYIANRVRFPLDEQGIINADIDGSPGLTGGDVIAIQKIDAGILVLD